jgi:membrane associated rhomboid family serine protease
VFNAPWPALVVVGSVLGLYAVQAMLPPETQGALIDHWALVPSRGIGASLVQLVTYQFLHGGWLHALANAAVALAFGPPVARLFGTHGKGVAGFFTFYMVCAVLAGLGYLLLNTSSANPVIGASGAISGLYGAAARLMNRERRLSPIASQGVFTFTAIFVVLNVVLGVTNTTPGAEGMPVAWQAHLVGYFSGLLLIGPWATLFGRSGAAATPGTPQPDAYPAPPPEPVRDPDTLH